MAQYSVTDNKALESIAIKNVVYYKDSDTVVESTPINAIANIVYPIGSIYFSINSVSPQTLFGGTWEQIKDRFLLAAGSTYTNGSTGGEASHILTIREMPGHTHTFNRHSGTDDNNFSGHIANAVAANDTTPVQDAVTTSSVGGGGAHNNMPPYLVVYIWKRTA